MLSHSITLEPLVDIYVSGLNTPGWCVIFIGAGDSFRQGCFNFNNLILFNGFFLFSSGLNLICSNVDTRVAICLCLKLFTKVSLFYVLKYVITIIIFRFV